MTLFPADFGGIIYPDGFAMGQVAGFPSWIRPKNVEAIIHSRISDQPDSSPQDFRKVCPMIQASACGISILLSSPIALTAIAQQPNSIENSRVLDTVAIKSGGTLAGVVKAREYKDPATDKTVIALETPSGGQIMLDKQVAQIVHDTQLHARDYEVRVSQMADTPEAHWEIVNWLKNNAQARAKLKPQMDFHYRRIVELDPNDSSARRALGFVEIDGKWVDETSFYAAQGYVRDGGKWRSKLELDLIQRESRLKTAVGEAKKELNRFKLRLQGMNRQQAMAELKRIVTPDMVSLLFDEGKTESNPEMKKILVEAIGTQPTLVAGNALIWFAVMDPAPDVRDLSISLMLQNGYDRAGLANNLASGFLSNSDNQVVNRAAYVIGELGSDNVVLDLIQHVVTNHTPPAGSDPGRITTGLGNGGSGLSLGGEPPKGPQPYNNPEVVNALTKLTTANFQYSVPEWMKWYRENYTISDYDIHRDQ